MKLVPQLISIMIDPSYSRIVLFDVGYYHHYRYFASLSWFKRQDNQNNCRQFKENNCRQYDEFEYRLVNQYHRHLDKVLKYLNLSILDPQNTFFFRDSPSFRHKISPDYKSNRQTDHQKGYYLKTLNSQLELRFPSRVFRSEQCEADDLFYIFLSYLKKNYRDCLSQFEIILVTLDNDIWSLAKRFPKLSFKYLQVKSPIKILDLKPTDSIEKRVLIGDKSDTVSPIVRKSDPLVISNFSHSEMINELIQRNLMSKYLLNRQLIDPSYLTRFLDYLPFLERSRQDIQYGLCCLNTQLQKQKPPVFCSRKCILRTIKEKGQNHLLSLARQNCLDLITMIKWNYQNNIKVFRISSELFPHFSNPKASEALGLNPEHPPYSLDHFQDLLTQAGNLARRVGQRLTFHPSHFCVVGTPHEETFQKTLRDLDYHAEVLDRMEQDIHSVMVVHGGGTYNNKPETKRRWINNFWRLPERVRRRLVLENCERNFNLNDCLEISQEINIPVVLDTHHHECFIRHFPDSGLGKLEDYYQPVLETWFRRGIKPKFHVSNQNISKRIGAHSDYIYDLPESLLDIPRRFGVKIDIMVEAKMKEQAIFQLWKK